MHNSFHNSFIAMSLFCLASCGGSSSDSNDEMNNDTQEPVVTLSPFSLGLSDAPVDEAETVFIELDSITLIQNNDDGTADEIIINSFTDESGTVIETTQVNLLDYQGSAQIKIVDESQNVELENGVYEMELTVIDEGSFVVLIDDPTEHPIKVPSSRLRLGEFMVTADAVQSEDTPAYTIEFDLRQSLVMRGNANNNNGFIIKPHGVRIVSLAGEIAGTVGTDLTNLGTCTVYLYEGSVTDFGDMYDITDEDFNAPENEITASAPLATAVVADDGSYAIGFVEAGSYQVALTCGTELDDNVQFDGLTIPSAADITPEIQAVEVVSQQLTTVDFN